MSARTDRPAGESGLRRWLPLVVVGVVFLVVIAFDLHRYFGFEALREHRQALLELVARAPVGTALAFVAAYALATAISVPGAFVFTLAGGFLFGTWLGGLLSVTGATLGAIAIFLIAKTSIGAVLHDKAGPWLTRMEAGFAENAWNYLLVLRLVPIFPFWLVNLVPALLGVPLATYAITTFIGIIPGGFVYASVGNGLGAVFEQGGEPDLGIISEPEIILPILGLALLALIPVAYRYRGSRKDRTGV